jgi:hypothetical protein
VSIDNKLAKVRNQGKATVALLEVVSVQSSHWSHPDRFSMYIIPAQMSLLFLDLMGIVSGILIPRSCSGTRDTPPVFEPGKFGISARVQPITVSTLKRRYCPVRHLVRLDLANAGPVVSGFGQPEKDGSPILFGCEVCYRDSVFKFFTA